MARPRARNPFDDTTRTVESDATPSETTPQSPYLIVLAGATAGEMHKLTKERTVMGRGEKVDIRLIDEGISREHAQVVRELAGDVEKMMIQDLGSTNGTFCNGTRVMGQQLLSHGDKILIGSNTILRFSFSDKLDEMFQRQLSESALRDSLTRTFNKRYLSERLQSEFTYAGRHGTSLALIFLDIDHFKRINDLHGHPCGDAVLAELSALIGGLVKSEDTLARYGGEEFAIIARGTDVVEAEQLAEQIRRAVEVHPFVFRGKAVSVTISAGVSGMPDPDVHSASDLIALADQIMYEAKRSGRNRVCARKASVSKGAAKGQGAPRAD